jgi:hypothetical protein
VLPDQKAERKGTLGAALRVDGVVVAAAELAGDAALARHPLARRAEGAPPQLPALALQEVASVSNKVA